MRLHIVGPAPHQLSHGVDEEGYLWALAASLDGVPLPCMQCGTRITTAYVRVKDKKLLCPEHVERIEAKGFQLVPD